MADKLESGSTTSVIVALTCEVSTVVNEDTRDRQS